jgi:ribose-phosphate pyrophosphokinase
MKVIDSDNYAASGIETFFFPGGEPHARIPENFGDALLFLKPRTWNDVGLAMCVLNALYYQGHTKNRKVWLFCPYFPGARQDRTDYRTPVTREMIGRMLGQYVNNLYTFDLHSSVHFAGLRIKRNFMPRDLVIDPSPAPGDAYIIAPDHGAIGRAQDTADAAQIRNPVIVCEKTRDFATGKFTGFKMPPLPGPGSYVVIDDICDGGGTFNLLAEEFVKDPYAKDSELALWVSHGIFSKGLNAIHPKYELIMTTDSWQRNDITGTVHDPNRLYVVSLQPVIDKILKDAENV